MHEIVDNACLAIFMSTSIFRDFFPGDLFPEIRSHRLAFKKKYSEHANQFYRDEKPPLYGKNGIWIVPRQRQ